MEVLTPSKLKTETDNNSHSCLSVSAKALDCLDREPLVKNAKEVSTFSKHLEYRSLLDLDLSFTLSRPSA